MFILLFVSSSLQNIIRDDAEMHENDDEIPWLYELDIRVVLQFLFFLFHCFLFWQWCFKRNYFVIGMNSFIKFYLCHTNNSKKLVRFSYNVWYEIWKSTIFCKQNKLWDFSLKWSFIILDEQWIYSLCICMTVDGKLIFRQILYNAFVSFKQLFFRLKPMLFL